jgi:type VI secretion system protein ImpB
MASVHEKLERVRKPRVHIKYEVETEGAMVVKELPFVVGVLGDFSGDPTQPLKPFGERKFVQVDRDNFDDVMRRMTPGLNITVENTLEGDGSQLPVSLKFESMKDFEPGSIVNQVPALKALLEARNELRDLMSKADRSEELERLLEGILQNRNDLSKLVSELAGQDKAEAGEDPAK